MAGVVADFPKTASFGEGGTGVLERASNYDGTIFDKGDGTNESTQLTALNAYTYAPLGFFENFKIAFTQGDERIITTDQCSVGELLRNRELTPTASVDLQEILDMDNLKALLGLEIRNVAGTLTAITDEVINVGTSLDNAVKIKYTNGNGTKPTVTSLRTAISGGGTLLVEGTDYEVKKIGNAWYIIAIDGGAMTISTNYYYSYSYTPNTQKLISYKRGQAVAPGHLIRFTTCGIDGKFDRYFLVNAKLNSDVEIPFTNLDNNDFVPTSITFEVARGGNFFIDKEVL